MMKARSSLGRNFIEVCKCAGWGDVVKSLPTLVPPRALAEGVGRFRGGTRR